MVCRVILPDADMRGPPLFGERRIPALRRESVVERSSADRRGELTTGLQLLRFIRL